MKDSKIDKIITDTPLWVLALATLGTGLVFFASVAALIIYAIQYLKTQ